MPPPVAPVPPSTPVPPQLHLSRLSIDPGAAVTASGEGCTPFSPVALKVNGASAGQTTASAEGTFRSPVQTTGLAVGRYTVEADCGPVLLAALDVVLPSRVDSDTSTLAIIIFFILLGLALFRRELRAG